MKSADSNHSSDIPYCLDYLLLLLLLLRRHQVSKEFRHSVRLHLLPIEGVLYLLGDPFVLLP